MINHTQTFVCTCITHSVVAMEDCRVKSHGKLLLGTYGGNHEDVTSVHLLCRVPHGVTEIHVRFSIQGLPVNYLPRLTLPQPFWAKVD